MEIDDALQDVHLIKRLAEAARISARGGAPYFVIWGSVWILGYLLPWLGWSPKAVGYGWLTLDGLGAILSIAAGRRQARHAPQHASCPPLLRQWFWAGSIVAGLGAGIAVLSLQGHPVMPSPAFLIALTAGAWFALGGVLFASRTFLMLGLWIAALAVLCPFLPMASVGQQALFGLLGGGALLGAGLHLLRSPAHA